MQKIHEYLKQLYLKNGVTFSVEDGEIKVNYEVENAADILDTVLKIRETNYKLYLNILAFVVVGNYSHLQDLNEELTSEYEDEDDYDYDYSFDDDGYDEWSSEEELSEEDLQIIGQAAEELIEETQKLIDYIDDSNSPKALDELLSTNGDLDLIDLLLDFNVDLVFENSYSEICSMILAENDLLPIFLKFIAHDEMNRNFSIGLEHLIAKLPGALLYTVNSFYIFSKSVQDSYDFHKHIISLLLQRGLIDSLTTYISDILWDTYVSYKEQEENENLSDEAHEFLASYESDCEFRQRECYNLIFNPDSSNVLRLYLVFDELEYSDAVKLSSDIDTLKKKREKETSDYIRKLDFPKNKS